MEKKFYEIWLDNKKHPSKDYDDYYYFDFPKLEGKGWKIFTIILVVILFVITVILFVLFFKRFFIQ